jgi:tRNA(fMet)-specific endonuclease VapC
VLLISVESEILREVMDAAVNPDTHVTCLAQVLKHPQVLPLTILDFDREAARTYGKLRAWLEGSGKTIGALDMLIAAHALSRGLPLATNNVMEFSRVPGLKVLNWV